ncbi:chorismate mutase [Methanosalsum natronophilum]|uniref:Chorismate mutase n=1 Tax=Methanosalsum natronophilum TaxID=768733 RepID=A0A3R7XJD8_9EURY|nr:chorismate mutase [Methanosalsum natronophilum]MCS3924507.1 chorismate mutase [Methanosalsum natronophilum]RQD92244.1 MAG: chorismate mutase [Methanosalsum natronophilum]
MTQLDTVREQIEEIDLEIISLIKKRVDMADDVLKLKQQDGLPINNEEQNKVVLKRACEVSTELNLDCEAIKRIFQILIQMNIDRQHEMSGEGNLP